MGDRVQIPYSGSAPIRCPFCNQEIEIRVDVEFSAESVSAALTGNDLGSGQVSVKTNIKGASFSHSCRTPEPVLLPMAAEVTPSV